MVLIGVSSDSCSADCVAWQQLVGSVDCSCCIIAQCLAITGNHWAFFSAVTWPPASASSPVCTCWASRYSWAAPRINFPASTAAHNSSRTAVSSLIWATTPRNGEFTEAGARFMVCLLVTVESCHRLDHRAGAQPHVLHGVSCLLSGHCTCTTSHTIQAMLVRNSQSKLPYGIRNLWCFFFWNNINQYLLKTRKGIFLDNLKFTMK